MQALQDNVPEPTPYIQILQLKKLLRDVQDVIMKDNDSETNLLRAKEVAFWTLVTSLVAFALFTFRQGFEFWWNVWAVCGSNIFVPAITGILLGSAFGWIFPSRSWSRQPAYGGFQITLGIMVTVFLREQMEALDQLAFILPVIIQITVSGYLEALLRLYRGKVFAR